MERLPKPNKHEDSEHSRSGAIPEEYSVCCGKEWEALSVQQSD